MEITEGVTVVGQGRVRTPVDRVELMIGVEIDRAEPGAAFHAAAASVASVLGVLGDAGVDSRHVRTADLRLGPRTNWVDNREVVVAYTSGQRLIATLEGLEGVPRLLGDLATTGIEGVRFDGIAFSTGDPAEYFVQARRYAMDDARRKAGEYAELAGRRLGPALSVRAMAGGGGGVLVPESAMAYRTHAKMPVAAGESSVDVSVEVVFALL